VIDFSQMLSRHFALRELCRTSVRGFDNIPGEDPLVWLRLLCTSYLDPLRDRFGPIYVDSGYRCRGVNRCVGGQLDSAHLYGCAADVVALDGTPPMDMLKWFAASGLAYDQVIAESTATAEWLHVGILRPHHEANPRRQLLQYVNGQYLAVDLKEVTL
jgi:zinc D-Ala-D-Ala carboxypeptidase